MARRAKTVIGEKNLEQSRTMMQAAESGNAARQRATDSYTRQHEVGSQQGQQMARTAMQGVAQHEDRNLRRDVATGQQMLQKRGQELQEARSGFERTPGGPELPLLDRQQRLQAEMGKGTASQQPMAPGADTGQPETSQRSPEEVARLQQQGEQPIEVGQAGAAAPGVQQPGSLRQSEYGRRQQARADYQAETQRLHAQARFATLQNKALKAEFAGDKAARKQLKEVQDSQLERQKNLFTAMKKGTADSSDFKKLREWAEEMGMNDAPDGGQLMRILNDGAKSGVGPQDPEGQDRLKGFMRSYMDKSSIQYAMAFGELPGDFVDLSSPMMKTYMGNLDQAVTIMQNLGPQFQQFMGIDSYDDKLKMQYRWAGMMSLSGMVAGGEQQDITGGMQPSSVKQPQPAQQPGKPQEDLREDLTTQENLDQYYSAHGSPTGSFGLGGETFRQLTPWAGRPQERRPEIPLTEEGRVFNKSYEYDTLPSGETQPVDRKNRVYAERRQGMIDQLKEDGRDEAAAALAQRDREPKRVGTTGQGKPIFDTIPRNSNPDEWSMFEWEPGKFGWFHKKTRKFGGE